MYSIAVSVAISILLFKFMQRMKNQLFLSRSLLTIFDLEDLTENAYVIGFLKNEILDNHSTI
jgi:hypothetical protein